MWKVFWGYSGVFCRPYVVQNFIDQTLNNGSVPIVLFVKTKSSFDTPKTDEFKEYSTDQSKWVNLPNEVLLVGNKSKPHFAIVGSGLKKVDMNLDLSAYCLLRGMFPDRDNYFDEYFKYRVDKACGIYLPRGNVKKRIIKVSYSCVLESPGCVCVR